MEECVLDKEKRRKVSFSRTAKHFRLTGTKFKLQDRENRASIHFDQRQKQEWALGDAVFDGRSPSRETGSARISGASEVPKLPSRAGEALFGSHFSW